MNKQEIDLKRAKKGSSPASRGNDEYHKLTLRTKTKEDVDFISSCLKKHYVFYNISPTEMTKMAQQFLYATIPENSFIFEQNSSANSFYIINSGQIQVIINDSIKLTLEKGDCFGEQALLYNSLRSASCKSMLKGCELWVLDITIFKTVVKEIQAQKFTENRKFIENVQQLYFLTNEQKNAIATVIIPLRFRKDQLIIQLDDDANSFYFVKEGTVLVIKYDYKVCKLFRYDSFGEQALIKQPQIRQMTVQAFEDCVVMGLAKDIVIKILGDQVEQIIYRNIAKWALESSDVFGNLNRLIQNRHLAQGELILEKGNKCDRDIFLVLDGSVLMDNKVIMKGQIPNEFCFGSDETNNTDIKLTMSSEGVIGIIDYQQVQKVLGGTIQQLLQQNESQQQQT